MILPTAAEVRSWSRVDFAAQGFPPATPDPLDEYMARAYGFLGELVGRGCDPLPDTILEVPVRMEPLYRQALQRILEILVMNAAEDVVSTLADFQLLSSFSAGNYSETRRSLTELKDARMLVADPGLNSLLWMLMTPEKRSFWMAWLTGENEPAYAYEEHLGWPFAGPRSDPWSPGAVDWNFQSSGW